MYVAIDEAGDQGFKFKNGSTKYCVICLTIMKDVIPIENSICKLKSSLGLSPYFEFHFSKCNDRLKKIFLNCIFNLKENINIRCIIIDKQKIFSQFIREQKLYNFFTKEILKHDNGVLKDAIVYIDESRNKNEKFDFDKYINHQINIIGNNKKIKKIIHCDSKKNSVIQIADICAGAILRKYEKNNYTYYKIIRPLISDEWLYSYNK